MKKLVKRSAALLFAVALVMSMLVMFASAYTYNIPSSLSGDPEQVIYIHSALNPDKVVNVKSNRNRNGTKIQLWNRSKSDKAVKFTLHGAGDGWYYIVKYGTEMCLDVADGGNVQLYKWNKDNPQESQMWRLRSDGYSGSAYYYLENGLGYYLDVKGGSSKNGTQLLVCEYNEETNAQKWFVTPDWKMTWWD